MKFKGVFTERGAQTLERAFLPTIEKFGKSCQLLITPEQFCLVQTTLNTDGPQVCARVNTVRARMSPRTGIGGCVLQA
jgi:HUS1 checkpoint protein